MPFPASPNRPEHSDLFPITDPCGIGASILPIWNLMPDGHTLIGLGTVFRINAIGDALTAYHVLEDTFQFGEKDVHRPAPRWGANPLILEMHGYVIGAVPVTDRNWLPIENFDARILPQLDPFVDRDPKNLTEIVALRVPSKTYLQAKHPFLHCSNRRVEIGERLLATGFSEMDVGCPVDKNSALEISCYLHGSIRRVIEVVAHDSTSQRPWPRYIVDGDWPAGMSGGPVFDELGYVVGLVSTGSPGASYASARAFWGDKPFD